MNAPTDAWLNALPPVEEKLIRAFAVAIHAHYKGDDYNYNLAEDLMEIAKDLGWRFVGE